MEKLINFINRSLAYAHRYPQSAHTYCTLAFGGLMFYCEEHLEDEASLHKLWEETYRPSFEAIMYGGDVNA